MHEECTLSGGMLEYITLRSILISMFVGTLNKCQSWVMKTGLLIRDPADAG